MLELLWNAPVSESKMSGAFDALDLCSRQSVVDFGCGCGCGEVLIRLRERCAIAGVGIDLSADHIREATRRTEVRVKGTGLPFIQRYVLKVKIHPASIGLCVCLGATHAFAHGKAACQRALEHLLSWIAPGGQILIGESYLKQPAPPEYRALIGDFPPDDMTHAVNVPAGDEFGLVPLGA